MQVSVQVIYGVNDTSDLTPNGAAEAVLAALGGDTAKGDWCTLTASRPSITGQAGAPPGAGSGPLMGPPPMAVP